ncbi:hypothetical protein [Leptospira weilii]|uniref:hypothetical protein n=1 Tax=Leptospira weilii TaxID=28184 RepID=UPI00138EE5B1|nr:hypothetical protein [Leptospira weilii]
MSKENGFVKGFSSFGLHASAVKNKKSIKNRILTIFYNNNRYGECATTNLFFGKKFAGLSKNSINFENYFRKGFGLLVESVPKPFDLIRISVDRCNCSYVLGQALK